MRAYGLPPFRLALPLVLAPGRMPGFAMVVPVTPEPLSAAPERWEGAAGVEPAPETPADLTAGTASRPGEQPPVATTTPALAGVTQVGMTLAGVTVTGATVTGATAAAAVVTVAAVPTSAPPPSSLAAPSAPQEYTAALPMGVAWGALGVLLLPLGVGVAGMLAWRVAKLLFK
jgi:hypothetical protein